MAGPKVSLIQRLTRSHSTVLCPGSPYSLLRLCRIQVRQMLGPATLQDMLPTLNLPPSLGEFMQEVGSEGAWEGAGSMVKEAALQGGSEEYWQLHHANPT